MSLEHSPARQKRVISRREFRRRLGNISRTTEFRISKGDPAFPQLVQMTPGMTGYYEDEADAYISTLPRIDRPEPECRRRREKLEELGTGSPP